MEFLQSLFQQRLDELARIFLGLLQRLETTITPFCQPILAPHKIQYLAHIITASLKDERQRYVSQLQRQIQELKVQLNQQSISSISPIYQSKNISRNSTCSRDSMVFQSFDSCLKLPNLCKNVRRNAKNGNCFDKNANQFEFSVAELSSNSTIKKKNTNSYSQSMLKLQSQLKPRYQQQVQSDDEPQFEFKYLRI